MVTRPRRGPAAALVAAALILVAFMTLRPTGALVATPTFCIICGSLGGLDFLLNVILFVPLGMALRWATGRWKTAVIIGALTTLVIEALQWRLISGRDASLGDLLADTLGTMLGAWIAVEVIRWLSATGTAARRYAATSGVLVAVVIGASSWLLQPVRPRHPHYVQWTPRRPNMDQFLGQLLAVDVNDKRIRPLLELTAAQTLDTQARSLTVRATIGGPVPATKRQAIIVRIANSRGEGFSIMQWGEAAVFRTNIAADRVGLRPILVGLKDGLSVSNTESGAPISEFTIEARSNPRVLVVIRRHPGVEHRVSLRRTVGLTWALFMPRDVALGPTWLMANALWLGVLVLPVSFFTVRSGGVAKRSFAWWPLPLVLATLIAVPLTGLAALGITEWLGVLAGIAAGLMLERATATTSRART